MSIHSDHQGGDDAQSVTTVAGPSSSPAKKFNPKALVQMGALAGMVFVGMKTLKALMRDKVSSDVSSLEACTGVDCSVLQDDPRMLSLMRDLHDRFNAEDPETVRCVVLNAMYLLQVERHIYAELSGGASVASQVHRPNGTGWLPVFNDYHVALDDCLQHLRASIEARSLGAQVTPSTTFEALVHDIQSRALDRTDTVSEFKRLANDILCAVKTHEQSVFKQVMDPTFLKASIEAGMGG